MAGLVKRVSRAEALKGMIASLIAVVCLYLWFDLTDPKTKFIFILMCFTAVVGTVKSIFPDY